MRLLLVVCVVLASAPALARSKKSSEPKEPKEKHDALGVLMLDGIRTEVRWTDGDSFKVKDGHLKGTSTRLRGYNTLEAFGPVHRWGDWKPQELYALAKSSSQVAASKTWNCTSTGERDHYQRLLVTCADLAVEMCRQGHALAYGVDGEPPMAGTLEAQAEAMKAKRGMWKKGTVKGVVTSVHSMDEDGGGKPHAYNRVVDTRTGAALGREHEKTYGTCEEVCETTDGDVSCMTYVPFKQRYGRKPDCLKE